MGGDASPLYVLRFIYGQLFSNLPVPTTSFEGKTVIVTGSNVGLGLEAARHIVRLGTSKLIIACRSTAKGEAAQRDIEESTGCGPGVIEVWDIDLCSYDSVKAFAARAAKQLDRVDVLLANAGVAMPRWERVAEDETNITVNVVSTALLALLMLPQLRDTAMRFNTRPILTFVSSERHEMVDFPDADAPEGIFNSLNDESKANMADRYPTSKLVLNFIVREMAARMPLDSYPVTVNYINPGLCQSELSRHAGIELTIMKALVARTAEQGSRTLVAGACGGPETHGRYMDKCVVAEPGSLLTRPGAEKTQRRLWDELMDKLDRIAPGVSGYL